MSYLSTALTRLAQERDLRQAEIARQSGLSTATISRLMAGADKFLPDGHFASILNIFSASPKAQAELTAARCMDVRTGPAAGLVEITVKHTANPDVEFPQVHLSKETEKAFLWLRSQCPVNPDLEKHLVGYAKLSGMK